MRSYPHPRNPHTHGEEQITKLATLIKHHGFRHPITVSKRSGFIIAGHCRLLAAKALGLKRVPVDYQDFDNEAQEWAVLVSDNVIQDFAELDGKLMKDGLTWLDDQGYSLELTALTDERIKDFIDDPVDGSGLTEGDPIVQYNIIFDNEQQQTLWYDFLRWLNKTYTNETVAGRLDAYLQTLDIGE